MDWLDRIHIVFIDATGSEPKSFIYQYQTLIAGLLALLAAAITVWVIIRNHREIISRRHHSARSNLPIALSELHDYSNQCLDSLSTVLRDFPASEDIRRELIVPELPRDSLQTITELIEFSDQRDATSLQAILRFIQIQHARLISQADDVHPDRPAGHLTKSSNLYHDVLDACVLKIMADHLFPFARRETPHVAEIEENKEFSGIAYRLQSRFS